MHGNSPLAHPHLVVINLSAIAAELYLPTAYIVRTDRHGSPTYIQQRALPETLGAFAIDLTPKLDRLLALIGELEPERIEQHFRPGRKKVRPLADLLADQEVKKAVLTHIHRRLDEILRICVEQEYPLCLEAERKSMVGDLLLQAARHELEPELFFRKTSEGVIYQMTLREGRRSWLVREKDVRILTNVPAWVIVDYRLLRVEHINGFMLKPFQQKDTIQIPKSSVHTYFKRFIYKVASKTDIRAEGFDVIQHQRLEACEVEPVRLLFGDSWGLSIQMVYALARFNWSDKKPQSTSLRLGDGQEDIAILQVRRDKVAEGIFIAQLRKLGLVNTEGSYFQLPGEQAPEAMLHWLTENRSTLEDLGFKVKSPEWEGRRVALYTPKIRIAARQHNDWFDLYGEVEVGPHRIPFLEIARYIKQEDRCFPLPDGTVFLIPEEWMHRYREIAAFGRFKNGALLLTRSQFTLLDDVDIDTSELVKAEAPEESFEVPEGLRANLRPYQLEGVRWMVQHYRNELGACLADDMGLGKTLQTIAVLLHAKERKAERTPIAVGTGAQLDLFNAPAADADFLKPLNALIILPASLIYNWKKEIDKFAPGLSVYDHTGPKRYTDLRLLTRFDVIVTTYQTALRDLPLLERIDFEYIVLDESQQIKNRESKVFQAVNRLQARHKISLSGTPIENSLADLWSQMQFINPNLLGSFRFFQKEFITPIEKQQDEAKKERLRSLVQPYLLRRTKEEVARDLPPLQTKIFYSDMEPEQKKIYEREKSAARNYLLENFAANDPKYRIMVLQSLTKLRQLANHPGLVLPDFTKGSGKFNDVLEHWSVIRKAGHKALFFSSFVQYLELFRTTFEREGRPLSWLTGNLSPKEREREIQRFESDPAIEAFLISIKSGGTGLNLTAADYVFILDPWWNPTVEQQAIARAHRIGQDKQVIALKFITRESIEEKILGLQEKKARLAEDIIGNTGKIEFSREDLEFLLV